MSYGARWGIALIGGLLLLFGLACLNYTKAFTLERHQQVARQNGFPPPQPAIFYSGCAAIAAGGIAVGYALGTAKARK